MEHETLETGTVTATVPTILATPAPARWSGWILAAGLAVAVPSGWLLAYLAALPFLFGLFFFVLLGLIVGAVMFRAGSKAPPPTRRTLWLFGTSVVTVMILTSLWTEYQALPRSVEKRVRGSIPESLTAARRTELRDGVRQDVAAELAAAYPPGGFPGYLLWAARNGTFTCPRMVKTGTVEFRLSHRRAVWIGRVGVSILLAEWAVMAQLMGLRRKDKIDPVDEATAAPTPPSAS